MTTLSKVLIGVGGLIVIVGGILIYRKYQNEETTPTTTPTTTIKKPFFVNMTRPITQTVSKNRPTI